MRVIFISIPPNLAAHVAPICAHFITAGGGTPRAVFFSFSRHGFKADFSILGGAKTIFGQDVDFFRPIFGEMVEKPKKC
ncbi:MAG: hypothetical protein IJY16_07825 [Clostridia bacterium]|nr:hypothetical protein [Clostridia bacterium]